MSLIASATSAPAGHHFRGSQTEAEQHPIVDATTCLPNLSKTRFAAELRIFR
ncbi:hypothetical protein FTUN_4586 [Frigoriglobus tundricola]|uniref:Uncharacterized protein n=1 Tax=Frigoriglobus tundricola TaxID=2774151 RepID=A0A6M5YUF0_9BACT|nr:hypothetical protein FTUN_4586 [Frigoriglobus tundricola]